MNFTGDGNGWAPEEMFEINEKVHGVQSTFKENLEGYTIQLNKDKNSQEYRFVGNSSTCSGT